MRGELMSRVYVSAYEKSGRRFRASTNAWKALTNAGLGFTVNKIPLPHPKRPDETIEDHYAVIRADTEDVLGVVENHYTLLQNEDIASLAQVMIDEGDARITHIVPIGKGHKWFMFLDFPRREVEVVGDIVRCRAIVRTCHNGKFSAKVIFLPMRLACSNGLVLPAGDLAQEIAIYHRQSAPERLKDAGRILALRARYFGRFSKIAEAMARVPVSDAHAAEIVKKAVLHGGRKETEGMKERIHAIMKLFRGYQIKASHEALKGTTWGLLNAGAEYVDHHATQTRASKGRADSELLFESLVEGARFRLKSRFFEGLEQDPELGLKILIQQALAN
jgi:phage/plasmid-like protein (TIGR03299 family)